MEMGGAGFGLLVVDQPWNIDSVFPIKLVGLSRSLGNKEYPHLLQFLILVKRIPLLWSKSHVQHSLVRERTRLECLTSESIEREITVKERYHVTQHSMTHEERLRQCFDFCDYLNQCAMHFSVKEKKILIPQKV